VTEICGATDRFFYDKGWWRRWCDQPAGHRGSHFGDYSEYEAEDTMERVIRVRAERQAEAEVVREVESTTREPADLPEKLPLSPRKVLKLVGALDWRHQVVGFTEHRPAVLYVGATDGHNAGDVYIEAKDLTGIVIGAKHDGYRLGFTAEWLDGKFDAATIYDPIGIPVELYSDYSPNANDLRRVKDEPEWAWKERVQRIKDAAEKCDREYNTGDSWLSRKYNTKKATELFDWLADWQEQLTPKEAVTA